MALFGRTKKEEKPVRTGKDAIPAAASTNAITGTGMKHDVAHVLKSARISEKASDMQAASIYTFDVAESATKREVIAAVRSLYKVTPLKVAVVRIRAKARRSMRTGQKGRTVGGKKAYVYLKKGDTITVA